MMSGHQDPKTVMRYDHHRENIDLNAVNFLRYDEKAENKSGAGRSANDPQPENQPSIKAQADHDEENTHPQAGRIPLN